MISLVSTNPVDRDMFADIADVEVAWQSDSEIDPIVSISIEKNSVAYPVELLYGPLGLVTGKSNVGLFPLDSSNVIHCEVETLLGLTDFVDFEFDCRPGDDVQQLVNVQLYSGVITYGKSSLYSNSNGVDSVNEAIGLLVRPAASSEPNLLVVSVVQLVGASDITVASISATKSIEQLLSLVSVASSQTVSTMTALSVESAEQLIHPGSGHLTLGFEVASEFTTPSVIVVASTRPGEWVVVMALCPSQGEVETAVESINVISASGFTIMVDLLDELLGELR